MTVQGVPLEPPRRRLQDRLFDLVVWGGVIVLLIVAFGPVEVRKTTLLFTQSEHMAAFGREFMHPDFGQWRTYVGMMWLTIQIALWGTFLAIIIAVPLGLAAARNLTPTWIWFPVRRVLDLLRSVPDLVVGTVFIVAVGPGPFTGVLALAVNTGGVLAKLFSEAVEAIDRGPVEGVRATGAAPVQEIVWGVMPQVAPLWTSYALYRFESSARSATVLGIIGAGGIGQTLIDSINGFEYAQTGAIVLVVIVAVVAIDLLSQLIRSRLL
ncbi:MAG TPA: phosphonate ABC transporter, permease protein PhnE [Caulobacteraceae bacterium]|nr:phosphonate ABC transporter, permease protein PhnE [Caulobacteraceae bacterium]